MTDTSRWTVMHFLFVNHVEWKWLSSLKYTEFRWTSSLTRSKMILKTTRKESCGDCEKDYLTVSTFPGILGVSYNPKLHALTAKPVRIKREELYYQRLRAILNFRDVWTGDSLSSKNIFAKSALCTLELDRLSAKNCMLSAKQWDHRHFHTPTTARDIGPHFPDCLPRPIWY